MLIQMVGQKDKKDSENTDSYGAFFNNFVESEQQNKFAIIIISYLEKLNRLLLDPPKVQNLIVSLFYIL